MSGNHTSEAWERAAAAYLSAEDFQSIKLLAEAFEADLVAGVNSALIPASTPDATIGALPAGGKPEKVK